MCDPNELAPEPKVVRRRLQQANLSIGSYRDSKLCLNITSASVMNPNRHSRPREYHLEIDRSQLQVLKSCIEEELKGDN